MMDHQDQPPSDDVQQSHLSQQSHQSQSMPTEVNRACLSDTFLSDTLLCEVCRNLGGDPQVVVEALEWAIPRTWSFEPWERDRPEWRLARALRAIPQLTSRRPDVL